VRGALLPVSLLLAVVATAALGLLALRGGGAGAAAPGPGEPPAPSPPPTRREMQLRPYRTTATLTEDLRDVLATGDAAAVAETCWRVSDALRDKARWMLQEAAPAEASPRVRALLVLACGVHHPDDPALLAFLADRAAPVREAAALAAGYLPGSERPGSFLGVPVPLGRTPPAPTENRLRARLETEKDEGVRGAIEDVLAATTSR